MIGTLCQPCTCAVGWGMHGSVMINDGSTQSCSPHPMIVKDSKESRWAKSMAKSGRRDGTVCLGILWQLIYPFLVIETLLAPFLYSLVATIPTNFTVTSPTEVQVWTLGPGSCKGLNPDPSGGSVQPSAWTWTWTSGPVCIRKMTSILCCLIWDSKTL